MKLQQKAICHTAFILMPVPPEGFPLQRACVYLLSIQKLPLDQAVTTEVQRPLIFNPHKLDLHLVRK